MPIKLRTKRPDPMLKQVVEVLQDFATHHPHADIEIYRQNSVSLRIRIIDPDFKGQTRTQREEQVWKSLELLPEEVAAEISLLLLLTPDETKKSLASFDFDNPVASKL